MLILFGLVCVFTLFFFSKRSSKYRYDTTVKTTPDSRRADYSKRIHYLPEYAKETRTTNIGSILVDNYIVANKNVQNIVRKRSIRIFGITLADEGIRIFVLQFITMLYLVFQIQQGRLGVSSFVALFLATMQLSFELFNFVNCFNGFYKLSLYTDDLIYILNYESTIESESSEKQNITQQIQSINIENVSFSYNEKDFVLDDINMKLSKGDRIALVGHNGAGKTTLIKLLLHLYDPNSGNIIIDNINLKNINTASYRNIIGVVYQDYRYYALTIAENVLLKKVESENDRKRVIEALKKSQLYDDVKLLPNGIDTIITKEFDENGVILSGGQSQKLALARVFSHTDKQILIFDEASSAMDPLSEAKINKSILDFCRDKILILISHRLSTSKDMEMIYVLKDGKIIERGKHTDLMSKNGIYAEMFSVQSESYKL